MIVKIKKLDEMAQIPVYAKESDAGMDLVAITKEETNEYVEYGTGLAIEIPEGYVGLIFPRSSISKVPMVLANSVGVIDSGYRGEIKCRFKKVENSSVTKIGGWTMLEDNQIYHISDKVAQLVILPYPRIVLELVDELSDSDRASGGFGSTGK